ncbi:bifunctional diguanylate cyclase/phosphodiesterase [Phycisphaera mikurensis]|uniref:EAL domain-containing protein n=1 Tax=Phycisphaera mikurensis (strain NBRC 102666 / KCTC 22515 / FYK2301M01) TaxID=1142394 RepID=I0IGV9_PHYMF|nr:bifunctional diguanylate cyclase/phosphodiesterase [Phycisphaera mikurensis]MBB6440754.1 EAL domain-containing protein (putative c-di-GMP-specific phosphodiesterase class I) [Phycisphaera mikurensis]BAM04497.1 hypothetical protein PSMK_23380 [Phycisphaera mikurensis NBRC 102666]
MNPIAPSFPLQPRCPAEGFEADEGLEALLELAAETFEVPMAAITFLGPARARLLVERGCGVRELPRAATFCDRALATGSGLVIRDAAAEAAFRDHPAATGASALRFYAGLPFQIDGSDATPVLCVADRRSRDFPAPCLRRLGQLAVQASRHLALQRDLLLARRLAHTDEGTGLLNARGLCRALDARRASGRDLLVACLRLHRWNAVAEGTTAGDGVLAEAANRLTRIGPLSTGSARAGGPPPLLASLGRGTFAIGFEGGPELADAAALVSGEIAEVLRDDLVLRGQRFSLAAAVGLATTTGGGLGGGRSGPSGREILSRASLALTDARRNRGAGFVESRLFDAPMLAKARASATLESELRASIDSGRVQPAFQPIVDLTSSRVAGYEILARWEHPERGPIFPDVFIPLAEQTDLIEPLFACLARTAIHALPSLSADRHLPFLSLNLSKLQLHDGTLQDRIVGLCADAGVPTHRIHLELTESDVAESGEATATMHRLRAAGFELMLDDFGTGTSSLSSLHDYPVQWLKIDRGFTVQATRRRSVAIVADAVADLARKLNLRTVAEGLETAEEVPLFQAMGFDMGQGYRFGRPMPLPALRAWHASRADPLGGWLPAETPRHRAA